MEITRNTLKWLTIRIGCMWCSAKQYQDRYNGIIKWYLLSLTLIYKTLMNFRWLHTMKTTGLEVNFSADFGGTHQNIVESMHRSIAEISSRKGIHELNFCDWSIDWFGFKAAYFRQLFSHLNAVFYWLSQFLTIEFKWIKAPNKKYIKIFHST